VKGPECKRDTSTHLKPDLYEGTSSALFLQFSLVEHVLGHNGGILLGRRGTAAAARPAASVGGARGLKKNTQKLYASARRECVRVRNVARKYK